jgi:hypothetical protein
VAVAGGRVHHRHRRHRLDRCLQAFAAARDQQVDQALLGRQLGQLGVAAAGQHHHRVLGQPGLGQRFADDRRQRPVGALGVGAAAEHDRVAALDRQRRAVDGHVRARLVDDRDDAQRHPHLAQVESALQGFPFQLLADRVGEAGDDPHPLGHRRDPLRGQRQAVAQGLAEPNRALVGEVGRVRFEDLLAALPEQPRGRLQGGVLGLGRGAPEHPRGALGGGAGLSGGGRGHSHDRQG